MSSLEELEVRFNEVQGNEFHFLVDQRRERGKKGTQDRRA